ncbi:hypothetical protein [Aeromicrobium endophyticum]|uniref:Scaffolding protein n=1 Tax=Aeromicrobium endophyticum TaxID=2292704 RepID=A0A371PE11_9ACTN|nr:hypothetical protein [Aeromicrobium endophyticum]REK73650.1 hypothetical protein DX116_08985 [Aeromicrobium endophyticum]
MKNTLNHPSTGTRYDVPLFVDKHGRARYPIGGGSEDGGGDGGDAGSDDGSGGDGGDDEKLGDAGKKALQEERDARKAAEKRAKRAEDAAEALRNRDKSEDEKKLDEAKKAGRAEADAANNSRLVKAELRALAATAKMRDPRDAIAQLGGDLEDIEVDDGEVDSKALQKLLDDLKKNKAYLFDDGKSTTTHQDAGIGGTGGDGAPTVAPGRARIKSAIAATSKTK